MTLKMLTKDDCQLCDIALDEIEQKLPKEMLERLSIGMCNVCNIQSSLLQKPLFLKSFKDLKKNMYLFLA